MDQSTSKLFTPEEANRMLPLVSVIVRDVRSTFDAYSACKKELSRQRQEALLDVDDPSESAEEVVTGLKQHLDTLTVELRELVRELTDLGALMKDPVDGIVDFPFEHEGEVAYLCWKHGETQVTGWHDVDEGYAERKPLPATETAPLSR